MFAAIRARSAGRGPMTSANYDLDRTNNYLD